jgi:putative PEP-CTERM system histidine kinase
MFSFGVISYGLAATGFLMLSLLLAISWEGRGQGIRLVIACGINAAWAALLAYVAWTQRMPLALVALTLFLRDAAWLIVLTGLLSGGAWPGLLVRITHLLVGTVLAIGAVLLVADLRGTSVAAVPATFVLGGLALSLTGLVLLEQVYRNANTAGRHALKYLVIGLGVLFAYDLYVFSQAQLVKGIDAASWQARGLVNMLVVPLIALAARGNPQWSLRVFVSRHVVFYTTSFLTIGVYLLVMAAGGYLIRFYGGSWGPVAQIVFFAGAGIVLVSLLASASLRRQLRVFLSKHFYKNKYDYRLEWLRFIETLSSNAEGEDPYRNGVRSIAQIVNSPGGVLFMPLEGGQGFAFAAGWPQPQFRRDRFPVVPANDELFAFMRRRQWVVDLVEYQTAPDAYDNAALPGFLREQQQLRLLLPLMLNTECLGFVILADPPPPFELTYEDRDLLKTVGRHVATHLAQHDADRKLSESRQFEAYHRLTAFVMHDLKNLAAQLSLLVANAEKFKRNPEFVDDAIATIANSTARMQRLVDQLQRREMQSLNRRVSLANVAREACARCSIRAPMPACEDLASAAFVEVDPERLGMMVEHLIRNAQEATAEDGEVHVSVTISRNVSMDPVGTSGIYPALTTIPPTDRRSRLPSSGPEGRLDGLAGDFACLTVEDTGSGMSPEFIKERLFKPFDTTKGSKGMGIGAYQVREYVRTVGGRVIVQSTPGEGTRFTLWLPLQSAPEAAAQP